MTSIVLLSEGVTQDSPEPDERTYRGVRNSRTAWRLTNAYRRFCVRNVTHRCVCERWGGDAVRRATFEATITAPRGTTVHTIDVREDPRCGWSCGLYSLASTAEAAARREAQGIADSTRGTVVSVREVTT